MSDVSVHTWLQLRIKLLCTGGWISHQEEKPTCSKTWGGIQNDPTLNSDLMVFLADFKTAGHESSESPRKKRFAIGSMFLTFFSWYICEANYWVLTSSIGWVGYVRLGAGYWCRCRVPLQGAAQGAAVRVVCAPWRWHLSDPQELSQTSGTKWYLKVSLTYIIIYI
jgi:hypothetical protein